MHRVGLFEGRWQIVAPGGERLPTIYETYADAAIVVKELNRGQWKMDVPDFLNLCVTLTSQRMVSRTLGTQNHIVNGWITRSVFCKRPPEEINKLVDAVAVYYSNYPPIVEYVRSIEIIYGRGLCPI